MNKLTENSFIAKISSFLMIGVRKINCYFNEFSNYYPLKAVGQKLDEEGNTIVLYTLLGKRDVYEVPIKELMDNQELINKFPPVQASKFGAIALGDLIFSLPEEERKSNYNRIKNKMLI